MDEICNACTHSVIKFGDGVEFFFRNYAEQLKMIIHYTEYDYQKIKNLIFAS